uniref:hypothetical protein n=1 Tax=Enterocloster clostridioformis TaxID=1531 RepID=UPI0026707D81|nr:hypothetical protein [Enterocloster clostridioformis]
MIDGTMCIAVIVICLTVIQVYKLSIRKSICEKERAIAFTEMYKAEREARVMPSPGIKK